MPTFSRYNIRLSQIEDTPKVLSLYRDVAEKPGGLARLPFEITSHYVENFLKATVSRGLGFVAVDNNDDVVAEIHAYSPEIFCFSHVLTDLTIAVHPRFQGDGIGRALFEQFLSIVASERAHISRVELIARESNERALAFYESLGFEREGEMRGRILNADGSLESDIPMAWQMRAKREQVDVMNGITDLQQLLNSLAPRVLSGEWAFCTPTPAQLDATPRLADEALSTFRESEGLSLLLPIERATELELSFGGSFTGITLDVHSSLHAVGLTAVVATRLGEYGISANVIAAAFHDHVFVQTADAARALDILNSLHGQPC